MPSCHYKSDSQMGIFLNLRHSPIFMMRVRLQPDWRLANEFVSAVLNLQHFVLRE